MAVAYRYLGPQRLKVSAIGYGCPTFSGRLPADQERRCLDVLHRAVEIGVTYIDTADHNDGNNEYLLAIAFKEGGWRDKVAIATKVGKLGKPGENGRTIDCRPTYIKTALDACLKRLGTDRVDLLTLHRVDPLVPIEESVGAVADLVKAGKARHVGLSEAGPNSLRRAMATYPIAALQSEYSVMTRDYETTTLPVCRELGIGFVAYYPTGRGFFGGKFRPGLMNADEARKVAASMPRLQAGNVERNLELLDAFEVLARDKGYTPPQLALAWLLAKGDFIVPIPGTTSIRHLEENMAAAGIALDETACAAIDALFAPGTMVGERFVPARMKELNL